MKLDINGNVLRNSHVGRIALISSILALALIACGGEDDGGDPTVSVTVRGSVSNDDGSQKSFGGAGTVEAAAVVNAYAVQNGGALELLAEASVQADGSFEIMMPAEQTRVVLQAADASSEVVASALLEATGAAGGTIESTPMDSESSVEAEVFLAMLAHGVALADANIVDVRARIDEDIAVAVRAAYEAGDAAEEIAALAEAIATAQAAEIRAYADAGVNTSQSALFAAQVQASMALSAALYQGQNLETAYQQFFSALVAAAESIGADSEAQSQAEASASVSFRLVVEGRLQGMGAEAEAVADAAVRAAAELEAMAATAATQAALEAGGATADILASAQSAGAELSGQVSAAATAEAAGMAYADFSAALIGEASMEGSILGNHLQLDAAAALAAEVTVTAAWVAAAEFDAAAEAGVSAALQASEMIDPEAAAQAVVGAWAAYRQAVESAVGDNAAVFSDAALSSSIMIQATGSFRASGL